MVADPLGRFAYVANLVSNASGAVQQLDVHHQPHYRCPCPNETSHCSHWLVPQGIAIDPRGRFVYTATATISTVSMFTVDQTTGILTPTSPATVSVMIL